MAGDIEPYEKPYTVGYSLWSVEIIFDDEPIAVYSTNPFNRRETELNVNKIVGMLNGAYAIGLSRGLTIVDQLQS